MIEIARRMLALSFVSSVLLSAYTAALCFRDRRRTSFEDRFLLLGGSILVVFMTGLALERIGLWPNTL